MSGTEERAVVSKNAPRWSRPQREYFLFLGSDQGGERAAIFYTLIESTKLNGLNPETYLADIHKSPGSCNGGLRA